MKHIVYILTNKAMPSWIKVGYSKDLDKRLDELNRCTAVPLPFEVYAAFDVPFALADKQVHSYLEDLGLERSITVSADGRSRVREFFYISDPDRWLPVIRNLIAKYVETLSAAADPAMPDIAAKTIASLPVETRSEVSLLKNPFGMAKGMARTQHDVRWDFIKFGIPIGSEIHYQLNKSCSATFIVVSGSKVEFDGKQMSLTMACTLANPTKKKPKNSGFKYCSFGGIPLLKIREDYESKKLNS